MKSYKLSEAEDLLIGKKGTKERDEYEFELKLGLPANGQPIGAIKTSSHLRV